MAVLVSPEKQNFIELALRDASLQARTVVDDVQQILDKEREEIASRRHFQQRDDSSWIGQSFVPYSQVSNFLSSIHSDFSEISIVINRLKRGSCRYRKCVELGAQLKLLDELSKIAAFM